MKQYYLVLLLLFVSVAQAQITIEGTVTSTPTNETVPFVTVLASNGEATTTDENGNYTIEVTSEENTLRFSAIGYQTQTETVGNRTTINIQLLESTTNLDEVVITALGLERETKELGYTVQSLPSEEINEVKAVNFLDNLSGKLAGVTITPGPTGVGSTSRISIRGESSFSNNNPLFVVDGEMLQLFLIQCKKLLFLLMFILKSSLMYL